jgi:hypothetical protein
VVNLNMVGMRMGGTLRYMGNTDEAYMSQTMGRPPTGRTPISAPSGSRACVQMTGQQVLSYTVGSAPAALRISTTNAGTPRTFDTVLWVSARCQTTLTAAVCNDDDPEFEASADRRVSSLVTTEVLMPGTTVYILIGGFFPPGSGTTDHGMYDLTITEQMPVGAGMPCTTNGLTTRCDTGLSCVPMSPFGTMGTCRAPGSSLGAPCRASAPECDMTLTCVNSTCAQRVPAGMACDAFRQCEMGHTCLNPILGATEGVCTRDGTASGTNCRAAGAMGGRCDMGFTCSVELDPTDTTPTCERVAMPMGECVTGRVLCPMGHTCVTANGGAVLGRCLPNGSAARTDCRMADPRCDGALRCLPVGDTGAEHCANPAAAGGACSPDADCPTGSTCLLTDLSDRFNGRCFVEGALGGRCRAGATMRCDGMITCSSLGETGLCSEVQMMAGGPCHRLNRRCADGFTCVLNMGSTLEGTCVADGTAAGAECRAGDMPCAAMLTCAGSFLTAGVCQSTAAAGGMCDPLNGRTRCPMGSVCQPTAYNAGTCSAMVAMETEPNNSVMQAGMPTTTARNIRGSLPLGDVDCVNVTVAMNGGILASVSDGNGRCPNPFGASIILDVYSPDGQLRGIAQNSGPGSCGTVDGNRRTLYPWASMLPAGNYTVCARIFRPAGSLVRTGTDSYVLAVVPLAPM